MEQVKAAGKARSIGVSNVNVALLNDLLSYARIPPAVNQVELNPWLTQVKLRQVCARHNVHLTAYCPLASNDHPGRKPGDRA